MKIDIGVGGRFHADHMAKALVDAGHDVRLFTTFPASRFPQLPASRVHSRLWPEVVFRVAAKLGRENTGDLYKMRAFGRWMARAARAERADVFLGWSSFAKETLEGAHAACRIVVRDSAHIEFQTSVLSEEYHRLGLHFPDRSLCVARELAEYRSADLILVPSELSRRTFIERGVADDKIAVLPLGVDVDRFRAPEGDLTPVGPLRVLYFGTLSVQKGVHVLLEAMKDIPAAEARLELVGFLSPELRRVLRRYPGIPHRDAMPQVELAAKIRESHVFVFPTLHDGYGQVLPQAMASGLVPIVTSRAGSCSLVKDGTNGFVVPPGDALAIRNRIRTLAADAALTARLRREACRLGAVPTWDTYRRGLLALLGAQAGEKRRA